MKNLIQIHNLHLLISALIIIPVGLIYGFSPSLLFDVELNTVDENNVFKAIMGLYLAFGFIFIIGIVQPIFWQTATISNVIFMFGLAFGRIVSLLLNGIPSTIFCIGILGELILGMLAFYHFKKEKK